MNSRKGTMNFKTHHCGLYRVAPELRQRFYNRQFITRKLDNSDMLMKFDRLLHDYFDGNMQQAHGLPTVQYCADKLCMSSNYFGDMIKRQRVILQAIISANT